MSLPNIDTVLIRKLAQQRKSRGVITVSPLGRVGHSGARLLLCYVGNSMPYVVKIDLAENIRDERERATRVRDYFPDAQGMEDPVFQNFRIAKDDESPVPTEALPLESQVPFKTVTLGALLYRHMGGITSSQIRKGRELRDLIFGTSRRGSRKQEWSFLCPDDEIEQYFKKLYDCFDAAREACTKKPKRFRLVGEYDRYLRHRMGPEEVMRSLLGAGLERKETLVFLGAEIRNPLVFILQLAKGWTSGSFSPIHGDLHANNIIIDATNAVHLIDFAWAETSAHALKDFVLMECSLRFLLFPQHVNLDEQLEVDRMLLEPDGAKKLALFQSSTALAPFYRRLGKILSVVRDEAFDHAPSLNGGKNFEEYLLSQFMILYGNMKYAEYNRYIAFRALGLIASRIDDIATARAPGGSGEWAGVKPLAEFDEEVVVAQ